MKDQIQSACHPQAFGMTMRAWLTVGALFMVPIPVSASADTNLEVTIEEEELTLLQGRSARATITITVQIEKSGDSPAFLEVLEGTTPSSGLHRVSDTPPGGWLWSPTDQTTDRSFPIQNTFTGDTAGDYRVSWTAVLSVGGETRQITTTLPVHVIPDGGLGDLTLSSAPGRLSTEESGPVVFQAIYFQGARTPTAVVFEEVDAGGDVIQSFESMVDDGAGPDLTAGDLIYTIAPVLSPNPDLRIRYFLATAVFTGGGLVQSRLYPLPILPPTVARENDKAEDGDPEATN